LLPFDAFDAAQERPLFTKDEALVLRLAEVRGARRVRFQPGAIRLVRGQALERDQGERDVVRALK